MTRRDENWEQNRQLLTDAADAAGIDRGVVVKIAGFESNFDHEAKPISRGKPWLNTVRQFDGVMAISSAHGYGQFIDGTWLNTIRKYGEKYGIADASTMTKQEANAPEIRSNPAIQASMLAELTRENLARGRTLGGPDADANVYAFHNLGDGDAGKFLRALQANPNQQVDAVLSRAVVVGNPSLYGDGSRTLAQAYLTMGQKLREFDEYAIDAVSAARSTACLTISCRVEMRRIKQHLRHTRRVVPLRRRVPNLRLQRREKRRRSRQWCSCNTVIRALP